MHLRLIAHDIRSCHNVGSLLRTADGIGVEHVYLTGYTPYPLKPGDDRLPHISRKLTSQIHKTALGAEESIPWSQQTEVQTVLQELRQEGFTIVALEQAKHSIALPNFTASEKTAVLLGREVEGIDPVLLEQVDEIVEIPMHGTKESFNVVQATAMVLYHCRYIA